MQREFLNIFLLGIGYCFVFTASNSQGFISEPVLASYRDLDPSIPKNFGYFLQAFITVVSLFGNFLAAPCVKLIGAKWSLIGASLAYTLFMFGYILLNFYYFIVAAIVLGVANGILWGAMAEYISLASKKENVEKNSGLVWLIYMFSNVLGGGFFLIMFKKHTSNQYTPDLTREIFAVLTTLPLIGALTFMFLEPKYSNKEDEKKKLGIFQRVWVDIASTFRLLFMKKFSLLIPASLFAGLEFGLCAVNYTTALQFTKSFSTNNQILVAWTSIAIGLGELAGGIPLTLYGKGRFPYSFYVIISCILAVVTYGIVFINIPSNAVFGKTMDSGIITPKVWLALLSSFLMGILDSLLNIIMLAYICRRYPEDQSVGAYSLRNFLQSVASSILIYTSSSVSLHWQLLILVIFAVLSASSFSLSELRWKSSAKVVVMKL